MSESRYLSKIGTLCLITAVSTLKVEQSAGGTEEPALSQSHSDVLSTADRQALLGKAAKRPTAKTIYTGWYWGLDQVSHTPGKHFPPN